MPLIVPDGERIAMLAAALGRALAARGWRVATAESCTGGLVAGAITAIAGSSAWFDRGFVTYSNEAKSDLLGVPEALIGREGAVSEAVARALAEGALAASRAELVVAVTGVAGPGGGSAAKPVGMVCFAWGRRGAPVTAPTHLFDGDRAAVRARAVAVALDGLIARAEAPPSAGGDPRGPADRG
jgi:nicotinamide-nucleotide amidase